MILGHRYARATRVTFILGKPVRATTVFPEVFDRLRAEQVTVEMHVPSVGDLLPADVGASDLIVQRGLSPALLTNQLDVELAGTRHCNPVAATIAVADRAQTAQTLASHGIATPHTVSVATWPLVIEHAQGQPLVVKAADGSVGMGRGVLVSESGRLPAEPPFPGPYIVQDFIAGDGEIYKLYVAGRQTRGLVRRRPLDDSDTPLSIPFSVDPALAILAQRVRATLHLEIFGIDVLAGPGGPVIVDVNPFPGFRGVPQAAQLIADHLLTIAKAHAGEIHIR